jgi:hypothetical protein
MARNVVVLRGDPITNEEWAATEAITPGHLLEMASATTCKKNTKDAEHIPFTVALEREELGNEITDAYASGDYVKAATLAPGDRAYALIPSGQNISAGGFLEADDGGRLVTIASGTRLARALEAVNNAAGPGDARIRVEVM